MKNYLLLIIGIFIFCGHSGLTHIQNSESTVRNRNDEIPSTTKKPEDSPVIIHYGLNDSHSRSWVRESNDGTIGIAYFERFENSYDEGTLVYKTIRPDGIVNINPITTGTRLEKSVLLFDASSSPHIFVATSTDLDQLIDHYYKNGNGEWQSETIIHFYNEGGKFIYELSADIGPDYSFHLLILKARSNIDSDDYWDAWINSYLYHLTNATGIWDKELIHNYNTAYTYDHQIKISSRQDIKVDDDGHLHVIFGEQIDGSPDPSRLRYATNKPGSWVIETALNYDSGSRDEAGWLASLCLDNNGIPYVSCMYKKRVSTGSAVYCKLLFLRRLGFNNWSSEIVASTDDGYYGSDGRNYTGGLSHLVFDRNNTPHIIFSDIASAHWGVGGTNRLSVGNIRYAYFKDGAWDITTIYRQPLPSGFFNGTEMHGMCLIVSDTNDTVRIIGEEMIITGENQYSSELVSLAWGNVNNIVGNSSIFHFELYQNHPNPFNPGTKISYQISEFSTVTLKVYDVLGNEIATLVNGEKPAGEYEVEFDATALPSGVYLYKLHSKDFIQIKKMMLLK
jgi:hypothetical protein